MFRLTDDDLGALIRDITGRPRSLFADDMEASRTQLDQEIRSKSVLVIGGAGTIGSSFIKEMLPFEPAKLLVVDTNENGLAELTRDIRSSDLTVPDEFTTYPMDLGHPLTLRMIHNEGPFDVVANFAALKHVRSEKNVLTTAYLVDNNVTKAESLLTTLLRKPPKHFFCVSTDKAANPVNVMGATKRLMEDVAFGVGDEFKSTTARFANVAFSNGSLLDGFLHRLRKSQPLSMPGDVRRYFVSWEESGQLCLLACIAGESREIFTPKLDPDHDQHLFTEIARKLLERVGSKFVQCDSELEARKMARTMTEASGYPCHVFMSDTTGEKSEEIFSNADELTDDTRFDGIRVVKSIREYPSLDDVRQAIRELNAAFERDSCTKEQVIEILSDHLPTFQHMERNKYLDQRM